MKNFKKQLQIGAAAFILLAGTPFLHTAAANTVEIEDIEYKNGKIEVDFYSDLDWKSNYKITVTDSNNKTYKAVYIDRDSDEVDIYVKDLPQKQTFTVKVSGVRYRGDSEYTTAVGTFKTNSADIIIDEIDYEGNGRVEVDFTTRVSWKSPKVTVTDESGNTYTASISRRDSDECDISIKNMPSPGKTDKTYTFTISGVKARNANSYTNVSGSFTIPKAKTTTNGSTSIKIKDSEYDFDDRELDIEFRSKVDWNNPKVTISDSTGKTYKAYMVETDDDDCTIKVSGLTRNKKYNIKITGIKGRSESSYGTLTGTFVAYDD